jgi:hypothetical protein
MRPQVNITGVANSAPQRRLAAYSSTFAVVALVERRGQNLVTEFRVGLFLRDANGQTPQVASGTSSLNQWRSQEAAT